MSKIRVIAGPRANGRFCFRIDAKTKLTVTDKPLNVSSDVVQGYINGGYLEEAAAIFRKAEPKSKIKQKQDISSGAE